MSMKNKIASLANNAWWFLKRLHRFPKRLHIDAEQINSLSDKYSISIKAIWEGSEAYYVNGLGLVAKCMWENLTQAYWVLNSDGDIISNTVFTDIKFGDDCCEINRFFVRPYGSDLYGIVDGNLNWIRKPVFNDVTSYNDGCARVFYNGNWCLVDIDGLEIPGSRGFYTYFGFSEGLCPVSDTVLDYALYYSTNDDSYNGNWGYLNNDGNLVVSPKYLTAYSFVNGRALVRSHDNLWGVIDRHGHEVIPTVFTEIRESYDNNCFIVCLGDPEEPEDKRWGLLDREGKVLIEPNFPEIDMDSNAELAVVWERKYYWEDGLAALYDVKRKQYLTEFEFSDISQEKWGFEFRGRSPEGNIGGGEHWLANSELKAITPKYQKMFHCFSPGLQECYKVLQTIDGEERWGIIDKCGNEIFPFMFPQFETIYNEQKVIVFHGNKYELKGLMDFSGRELIPAKYYSLSKHGNFFKSETDSFVNCPKGLWDEFGDQILADEYNEIIFLGGSRWCLLKDNKIYIIELIQL